MSINIYKNINQLCTLEGIHLKDGRKLVPSDLSIIKDGCIVCDESEIIWIGETKNLPEKYNSMHAKDCSGHVFTPQIVDSHTHLVFGGNRSSEYTLRLNGADYEEIAKFGGGILSTMKATQNLSFDDLYQSAFERIETIASYGIGAIEIKSGYALNFEKEKIISEVIYKLKQHFRNRVDIHNTFLAAHAIPPSFASGEDYLNEVVIPLLKELAAKDIIDSVDIFHEQGYFSEKDVHLLFKVCQNLNLPRRMHADEFHDNDGATLAVAYDCLSCDHLLKTSAKGIQNLANSRTVATLLPGTALFLGKPFANARTFLDAGCKVAIASDYNPGSCHCDNLLMIASITAKVLKLNIAEIWAGITYNAAHALGLNAQGALIPGNKSKFTIFKCESIDEITYNWGKNLAVKTL